jgi:hypothetical protein
MPYRWDRKAAAAGEYHLAAGTGAYSLALCTPFLNHSTYDPGSDVALIGSWLAERPMRKMLATCNPIGHVNCVISASTRGRLLSQADVEATASPYRSVGAGMSGALTMATYLLLL